MYVYWEEVSHASPPAVTVCIQTYIQGPRGEGKIQTLCVMDAYAGVYVEMPQSYNAPDNPQGPPKR